MVLRTEQERAREQVRRMLGALAREDLSDLQAVAGGLIGTAAGEPELLRPALAEMCTAIAQMVHAKAGPAGPDSAFVVDLVNEGSEPVDIDALPPALRALLRAVLAQLQEHPADADYQLSMAARDPRARGRLDALVHGLLCTNSLLEQDRAWRGAPSWLAGATT